MLQRQAYKFRLKPSPEVEVLLRRHAGCARWIWNHVLRMNQHRLEAGQRILRYEEAAFWLTLWKRSDQYGFLTEAHSQPLQQVLKDLDRAYKDAFDPSQPLKRLPRFKRKEARQSFRFPQGMKLDGRRV